MGAILPYGADSRGSLFSCLKLKYLSGGCITPPAPIMSSRRGRSRSGSRGVSSVIGGLIVLAIIFTTVIPLVSFISQMSLDFENAAIERRILDEAKKNENIEASAYQDFSDGGKIKVWIRNAGTIALNILRIWVIDKASPDPDSTTPILVDKDLMPYSSPIVVDTGIVPTVGRTYDVIVFTERGNAVVPHGSPLIGQSAASPLDVTKFPYTLTVTLLGLHTNRYYYITLQGNIPGGSITYNHRAFTYNSTVSFAFGVNPGNYTLTVTDSLSSFTEEVSFSVPEVLHITIRVPAETGTASAVIFASIPAVVRRNVDFYVGAFVVNTGSVSICSMSLTITVSSGFTLFTPQTQSLWPTCIEPGQASAPIYWRVRATSGGVGTITIEFSGQDPGGDPVPADPISQRVFRL